MRLGKVVSVIGTAVLATLPTAALAHERWFVAAERTGAPSAFFRSFHWLQVVAVLVVVAALVGAQFLDKTLRTFRFAGGLTRLVARLSPWMPTVVGVATGATLIVAGLGRTIIAPHLLAPDTILGTVLVVVELLAGVALVLGFGTRVAAGAIIALVVWGVAHFGLRGVESVAYVGVAIFLLIWGRGRLSLGSIFSRIMFALDTAHMKPVALSVMRILCGVALVWGALDKVLHPEFHFVLLDIFENNPYSFAQLMLPSLSKEVYLLMMASVEMTLGLLLVTGWMLRATALVLAGTFVIFVAWFGTKDLVGHLPYIAAFLTFVVLGKTVERQERL